MPATVTRTAVGPMALVASEQHLSEPDRLITDEFAYLFLPTSIRWIVSATRWRPFRNLLVTATESKGRGLTASLLCRKRYIDDKLHEAADVGMRAALILGAGLDTLAYRHPVLAEVPVFEVDLPQTIKDKDAVLRSLDRTRTGSVSLVPIDFDTQNLSEVLVSHGFDHAAKTFVVWEGVTQYLSAQGIRDTMTTLSKLEPGSRLIFTYLRKDFLDGDDLYGAGAAHREFTQRRKLWRFGLHPEQVGPFLAEYGWQESEQLGGTEFTSRYVAPTGRALPVSEAERTVYAEKT